MRKRKSKKIRVMLILTMLLVFLPGYAIFGKSENNTYENTYYKHIQIQSGDSLWSIASEYANEGQNINQYIKDIKEFNKMRTDVLRVDEYLIVPVYF